MRPARKRLLMGAPDVRRWWIDRIKTRETPFFASASTHLSPANIGDKVPGRYFSAVFEQGTRVYCFENQADRDRFLTHYRKVYDARPCGNPVE